jgi:hypothetical protein
MKGPTLTQAKNREEESTMISKTCCIARMIVLASFALSSAAWAATCSNASLSKITLAQNGEFGESLGSVVIAGI